MTRAHVPATEIELEFGDGDYLFALKLPQLGELQEKCKAGILTIYSRVIKGRYTLGDETIGMPHEGEAFSADVYEAIRLGLIGGGSGMVDGAKVVVDAQVARKLMERYVYPIPFKDAWGIAAAVLSAKIEGYDPPGKDEPPVEQPDEETTAST